MNQLKTDRRPRRSASRDAKARDSLRVNLDQGRNAVLRAAAQADHLRDTKVLMRCHEAIVALDEAIEWNHV